MKLILVRHGETLWNTELRVQGRLDIPLNERGARQSELISERLRDMHIDAIYSSPLARAYHTAEQIALFHRCGVRKRDELIEIFFGEWEGMRFSTIAERYPELFEIWRNMPGSCRVSGAETMADVQRRALGFIDKLKCEHDDGDVVAIVSHTVPLKTMIAAWMGLSLDSLHSFRIDNCACTELELRADGTRRVVTLNEIGFLESDGVYHTNQP